MASPEPRLAALMTFYMCFIVLMFGEFPTKFLENICDKLHTKDYDYQKEWKTGEQ